MTNRIVLNQSLAGLREQILQHPIYAALRDEAGLRLLMRSHVFAVWDFMSLLKSLQQRLTSVDLPWRPVGDPESRRLVNEIVLAEESDEFGKGAYASHFEIYLHAMREAGADTAPIDNFLKKISEGMSVEHALEASEVPAEAKDFVRATFGILESESVPGIAAALAYGREDLVPPMFFRWVQSLGSSDTQHWSTFLYYLERHVQVDGELHGPMAGRLLERLCGSDAGAWGAAERAATAALSARLKFWNALHRRMVA